MAFPIVSQRNYKIAAMLACNHNMLQQLLDTFPTPFPGLANWTDVNYNGTIPYSWTDPISGKTRGGFTFGPPVYIYADQT